MASKERKCWFEKHTALDYIRDYLQSAEEVVRIASGFFTVAGWNLIRRYTQERSVYLLVGLEEPGEDRARLALIKEIMRELRTGADHERRQAVQDLVDKLQRDEFHFVDARAKDHHAKLYIFDSSAAIIASSNLTLKGLQQRIEAGAIVKDEDEVTQLVIDFDNYFAEAKDLTVELLTALLNWLELATPWDIYLKTMLALENYEPIQSGYTKSPVSYQVDMITQTLRQIRDHSGSMLVASTGLGKTVVAVHVALQLRDEGLISSVMVISPKAVQKTWEREMLEAGLSCKCFVSQTFDAPSPRRNRNLKDFEDIKELVQKQDWLVIIDESHEYRNRYKKDLFNRKKSGEERLAFKRLRSFIKNGGLKVLLLTGSPYATDQDNINSQLHLLPHTADKQTLLPSEWYDDANTWEISQTDDFIHLPVTSQLTTPHVAKYYGQKDSDGETFIVFGENNKYIPQVTLYTVPFPLLCEEEVINAIHQGCFEVRNKSPMLRDWCLRLVKVAWASSPLSFQGVLECVIDTPSGKNSYKADKNEFLLPQEIRKETLQPILKNIKALRYEKDYKLQALLKILHTAKSEGQKVIIFCERRATVVYLAQALQKLTPEIKFSCTIKKGEDDYQYQMKETSAIEELITIFAPEANNAKNVSEEETDVFIATDAYGVGVNMQDASVVVSYDIDWTPIAPVQRAGRILRFWRSPRTVKIYTFVPELTSETELKYESVDIRRRWENLMVRHGESKKLTDLPVLTLDQSQEVDLKEMASQGKFPEGKLDLDALADLDISPFYQHKAKLQLNRNYAKTLPDDIVSAKTYSEPYPSVYILLLHQQKYYGIVYQSHTKEVREPSIVKLLELIECDVDTKLILVDPNTIESLSAEGIKAWCSKKEIPLEEVERICTLYLQPETDSQDLKTYLQNSV